MRFFALAFAAVGFAGAGEQHRSVPSFHAPSIEHMHPAVPAPYAAHAELISPSPASGIGLNPLVQYSHPVSRRSRPTRRR